MDLPALFVTGVVVVLLVALMTEKVSLDALGVGLIAVLAASGIVDLETALHGFGNHAVITIAALYVVGAGLTKTGAVEFVAQFVLEASRGDPRRLLVLVGLVAGGVSAFLNNTAVVVVFIPVLIGLAQKTGTAASRLMIPLAYASLLGGMCTLVGTSTNLLVSGVAEDQGLEPIGMFELSPIGIPMCLIGVLFMALTARRLLPVRKSHSTEVAASQKRLYVTELAIGPTSPLLGKIYSEAFRETGTEILFVERGGDSISPPFGSTPIEAEDVIVLQGGLDELTSLQTRLGLKMVGNLAFNPKKMTFYELAIAPHSGIVGRRIGDLHLYRDFGCVVVAVLRDRHQIRERASQMKLEAGDLLLVCGDPEALARIEASTDFYLVSGAHRRLVLRQNARRALIIAGGVVGLFALKAIPDIGPITHLLVRVAHALPLPVAALLGAVAMVAAGCVTARRAYRTIDWPILIFVVGTLALGEGMRVTGAASLYANTLVGALRDMGPAAVVGALILLAIILNAIVSHSAVAVLLTPIAIETAHSMGLDPRPFILAVAFGGSLAFATPLGHQVNLMVYAPGGYRFTDFLRMGIPLSLVCWAVATFGIAWRYGL